MVFIYVGYQTFFYEKSVLVNVILNKNYHRHVINEDFGMLIKSM